MENLSIFAVRLLLLIEAFENRTLYITMSESPEWEWRKVLLEGEYIGETQGYTVDTQGNQIPNGPGYMATPKGRAYLLEYLQELYNRDIKTIALNQSELKTLKDLRKNGPKELQREQILALWPTGVIKSHYIDSSKEGGTSEICEISNLGMRYFEANQLSYISKISPIIISGISLLVSILALALSA